MKDIKRITFVGNFDVPYSTESHHLETFKKLGIEVITLQENRTDFQTIVNNAITSDFLYWTHTHDFKVTGNIQLLNELKIKKIPIVSYHLDLWLGIERQKDLENDEYWKWVDYFFCTDKLMVDWLNERISEGYPTAFFLPAGVFDQECYKGNFRAEFAQDVVFVGSRGYHKEWPYREKLISWLEQTYGSRFKLYDHGHIPKMRGQNLNDLYASAKVVIGDTLCKNFDYPYYLSDRVFETIGRGGFLIMPYIKGLEELFDIGKEIITYDFNDFHQLKYKIDYYLAIEKERRQIQEAGHLKVKELHTYKHRILELLATLQNEIK